MKTRDSSPSPGRTEAPASSVRPPGFLEVLREAPGFRRLFLARTTSLLGDWFNLLGVLALLRETVGLEPTVVSALLVLKLLPAFVLGPLAGVVADRCPRRAIMIVSDLARFAFVCGLFLAVRFPEQAVGIVLVCTALQMGGAAFGEPARSASIPNLVRAEHLAPANALNAVAWSVMFTLGAGLGGVATELFGWRWALALDAGTYLVSAALVRGVQLPPARQRTRRLDWAEVTGVRDFAAGFRYVAVRPRVATTLLIKAGWGVAGAATLILTLFGERVYPVLGKPDLGISLLYVSRAIGTGLGPVLSRRITRDESGRMRRYLVVAFIWSSACYGLFSIVNSPGLAALCIVAAHLGGSAIWVDSTVLLQRAVPDEFRGRVFAADLGLAMFTTASSTWVYGQLAGVVELRLLPRLLSGSLLVPALLWAVALTVLWRRGVESSDP